MRTGKTGTVALVLRKTENKPDEPVLVERLSDDREIAEFEAALQAGQPDPLEFVYGMRERVAKEEEEFGDYVESLLCQPFVRPDIQQHGVEWFRSKMRLEKFKSAEKEAAEIIAGYAYKLFLDNPDRDDFFLAGPSSKVRVRIFALPPDPGRRQAA